MCSGLKITIRRPGLKQRLFQSSCNSSSCCLPPSEYLGVCWNEQGCWAGLSEIVTQDKRLCLLPVLLNTSLKLVLVASSLCSALPDWCVLNHEGIKVLIFSFAAMGIKKCSPAEGSFWLSSGSGTGDTRTSQSLCHRGGRSSPDLMYS